MRELQYTSHGYTAPSEVLQCTVSDDITRLLDFMKNPVVDTKQQVLACLTLQMKNDDGERPSDPPSLLCIVFVKQSRYSIIDTGFTKVSH